jgi:hypothetical protein
VDHRHPVDRLVEIFDDWLRTNQGNALVRIDHDGRLTRRVQIDELIALFPWVFAYQLVTDALLGEHKPYLARKGAKGKLEELPHGEAV